MLAVAHRGYSAAYPENSTLAFEKAIDAGADFIETDVRLTRDGRLACWHDPDLRCVTGARHPVSDLCLDALKAIALPRGQHVLALDEVLAIARGRTHVVLDIKVATEPMIETVLSLLDATGMTGEVVYGARTLEHLAAVRRRCARLALLGMPASASLAGAFLEHDARGVRFWEDEVTVQRVRRVRAAGREVWVTAGLRSHGEPPGHATVERVAALMRLGVSAVLLNDPRLVRLARALPAGTPHAKA